MIEWTIPAQFAVTSSAESVVTRSYADTDGVFSTYYSSGSTSWGPSGRTEYLSSSSSSIQGSGPGQSNGTVINNTFRAAASVQTSTTIQIEEGISLTSSYVDSDLNFDPAVYLTTTKTGEVVEFVEATAPQTIYTLDEFATRNNTQDATTMLTGTQTSALAATVLQADTRNASGAEVLYVLTANPTQWSGYGDATAIAQSATRTTIYPVFEVAAVPIVDGSVATSSTVSNSAVTWSTSWSASRTTQQNVTTLSFSGIGGLQPVTGEATASAATTTQSQSTFTVFGANTLSYGRTAGGNTTSSATTSVVTSYGNIRRIVERYAGTLLFESTVNETFSTTRYITTSVAASLTSSQGNQNATSTTQSGVTVAFAGDQTIYPPAQAGAQQIGGRVGPNIGVPNRTRVITFGAVLDSQSGQYFTASFDTFVPTASLSRGALTIFPATNGSLTVDSNFVTYTTSTNKTSGTGTESTTASGVVSVAGSSSTRTEAFFGSGANVGVTIGRPQHHGAHEVGKGCSIIDIMEAGAFRDRIDGTTSSFYGNATRYTEGQSAQIRYWSPIAYITPLELRANKNAVTFSNKRNIPDTPPVSSLNAW